MAIEVGSVVEVVSILDGTPNANKARKFVGQTGMVNIVFQNLRNELLYNVEFPEGEYGFYESELKEIEIE